MDDSTDVNSAERSVLVSIPVALFTHWAYVCWVLIPVGIRVVMAYLRRRKPHLISPVAPAPAS